jgi:hypothetical protein
MGLSKDYAYSILKPASATPSLRGNGAKKVFPPGFFWYMKNIACFLLVSGKYHLYFCWYRENIA